MYGKNKNVGIAGPKVLDMHGIIQPSRCSMRTDMLEMFQIYKAAKFFCRKKWSHYFCLDQNAEKSAYVYHVSGCCFAMSHSCAIKVAPLDEGMVLYHEELILGRRMEKEGLRTMYEPKSVVFHRHGATAKESLRFLRMALRSEK